MVAFDGDNDGVIVRRERLKAGRSITVPAGGVVWLPENYRAATLIIATPKGDPVKHGPAPLNAKDRRGQ